MSVLIDDSVAPKPIAGPLTIGEGTCVSPQEGYFLGDDGVFFRTRILTDKTAVPQTRSMGSLSILPLEIIHQILAHIDVCTLVHFHNINRGTLEAVTSMFFFPLVASFPRALGSMVILENNSVTLPTLATCLQSTECSMADCAEFGDVIYTLKARRVCSSCMRQSLTSALCPSFRGGSPLSDEQLRHVPRVRSISGRFGMYTRVKGRVELLDRETLLAAETEALGLVDPGGSLCTRDSVNPDLAYMTMIPAPYLAPETGRWESGRCCLACGAGQRFTGEGMREHVAEHGAFVRLESGHVAHSGLEWKPPITYPWAPGCRGSSFPGLVNFSTPLIEYDVTLWGGRERELTEIAIQP